MRILQVTQSYYPFLDRGGPAVKVRAMARGLTARGHSVTVLTADLGLARNSKFDGSATLHQDRWGWRTQQKDHGTAGLETVYLSSLGGYRALTLNPRLAAWCRARASGFDLAHIFGFYDLLGPAAARACRRAGVPYVFEPMGMFRPIVRNIPLKRMYRRLLGDAMALGARRVIATSDQEQRELVDQGLPANHIVIRRNGIEMPDRLPPRGEFRRAWNIPPAAPVVLFLGRLVTKKSPELLLEAFATWQAGAVGQTGAAEQTSAAEQTGSAARASRSDAVLVFAGPAESSAYQQELASRAHRLVLDHRVLFTGPLYDDAKWAAYRDADVFVLPSQNENFGNAAAEAVLCGTPALVTDRCGVAPLIAPPAGDRDTLPAGVVVPHDAGALAAALGRMLENAHLKEELRRGCAALAQSLDWTQPLDDTESLYAELLDNKTAVKV